MNGSMQAIQELQARLPLASVTIEWTDPTLVIRGAGWAIAITTPWRLVLADRLLVGSDHATQTAIDEAVSGRDIVACDVQSRQSPLDPALTFDNGVALEIFSSTHMEPWILTLADQGAFVADPSGERTTSSDSWHAIEFFAQWDGCELDLAASEAGLLDIVNGLRSGQMTGYVLKERGVAHSGCVNVLRLEIKSSDEEKMRLLVDGQTAILSGNPNSLALLAHNLEFLRSQWSAGGKQHRHFDPSSDALFLSQESGAFIVGPIG